MNILGTVVQMTPVKNCNGFNQAGSLRNVKTMMSHYIIKIQNQVAMNHMKLSPLNHQREYKLGSIKYHESQCILTS